MTIRAHGIFDYFAAIFLLFFPFVVGFSEIKSAQSLFLILGIMWIGYSMLTRYNYAAGGVLPMGWHITFDVVVGLAVMLGPNFLDYRGLLSEGQFLSHVVAGLAIISLAVLPAHKDIELTSSGDSDIDRAA